MQRTHPVVESCIPFCTSCCPPLSACRSGTNDRVGPSLTLSARLDPQRPKVRTCTNPWLCGVLLLVIRVVVDGTSSGVLVWLLALERAGSAAGPRWCGVAKKGKQQRADVMLCCYLQPDVSPCILCAISSASVSVSVHYPLSPSLRGGSVVIACSR